MGKDAEPQASDANYLLRSIETIHQLPVKSFGRLAAFGIATALARDIC
jgi:hypothetical protein